MARKRSGESAWLIRKYRVSMLVLAGGPGAAVPLPIALRPRQA